MMPGGTQTPYDRSEGLGAKTAQENALRQPFCRPPARGHSQMATNASGNPIPGKKNPRTYEPNEAFGGPSCLKPAELYGLNPNWRTSSYENNRVPPNPTPWETGRTVEKIPMRGPETPALTRQAARNATPLCRHILRAQCRDGLPAPGSTERIQRIEAPTRPPNADPRARQAAPPCREPSPGRHRHYTQARDLMGSLGDARITTPSAPRWANEGRITAARRSTIQKPYDTNAADEPH